MCMILRAKEVWGKREKEKKEKEKKKQATAADDNFRHDESADK